MSLTNYYRTLNIDMSIPIQHKEYLKNINYTPKVIYDIGSSVLHWADEAKKIWPNSNIIAFEGMQEVNEFYNEKNITYFTELVGDKDGREVEYYYHTLYLGGNSYYRENPKYSPAAVDIYKDENKQIRKLRTVDSLIAENNLPYPDFIKIDTQGSEIDILKGMVKCLKYVKHLIVELQHVEYNIGANLITTSIPFIESLGFKLVTNSTPNDYFCGNGPDADYHFIKDV